jgi:hypothetical protein
MEHTLSGRERPALLHVPADVSKEKPLSLVFAFLDDNTKSQAF